MDNELELSMKGMDVTSRKYRVWAAIRGLVFGMLSCSHCHGLSKETHVSKVANEART